MKKTVSRCTLLLFLLSVSIHSQIDLNAFSSNAVKDARWMQTDVDSLFIESTVSRGIVTTVCTLVLRPVNRYYYGGAPEAEYDSIEISTRFNLPNDFVAQELYLWIDGVPERGYIQDRFLAASQYESIVGQRLDPALLETFGNGAYRLRIFPAETGSSRKISIQFQHTLSLNDSTDGLEARLPVSLSSHWMRIKPFYTRATFRALDQKEYSFTMDGLGSGAFSEGNPLTLIATLGEPMGSEPQPRLAYGSHQLPQGIISTANTSPTGSYYAWAGFDSVAKKAVMGLTVDLSRDNIVIGPEPQTRIIAMDLRNKMWSYNNIMNVRPIDSGLLDVTDSTNGVDVLDRAKKLAILSLQQYVSSDQLFNIVLDGRSTLFPTAVYPTEENLSLAYRAILNYTASESNSPVATLRAALSGGGNEAVVILISDLQWNSSYSEPNGRYNEFDNVIDSLNNLISGVEVNLFTISDSWQLDETARKTGGKKLSSLRYGMTYYGYSDNPLLLPPLFKNNNDLRLVSIESDARLEDVVFSVNNSYQYQTFDGMRIFPMVGGDFNSTYYNNDYYSTYTIHIAAKQKDRIVREKTYDFTIRGKYNGLPFVKNVSAYVEPYTNTTNRSIVQWGYRKAEWIATMPQNTTDASIRAIGEEYHIVTRGTSLLALEPWMELWNDSMAQSPEPSDAGGVNVRLSITAMAAPYYSYHSPLDSISIDQLIEAGVLSSNIARPQVSATIQDIKVQTIGSGINFYIPASLRTGAIEVALYDLSGRLAAKTVLSEYGPKEGVHRWNLDGSTINNRRYVLRMRVGLYQRTVHLPMLIR